MECGNLFPLSARELQSRALVAEEARSCRLALGESGGSQGTNGTNETNGTTRPVISTPQFVICCACGMSIALGESGNKFPHSIRLSPMPHFKPLPLPLIKPEFRDWLWVKFFLSGGRDGERTVLLLFHKILILCLLFFNANSHEKIHC
jgi:hypothetical protein